MATFCEICNIGFPDKARLLSHRLTCTVRIERGAPFQNVWLGGAVSSMQKKNGGAATGGADFETVEKILPASQPVEEPTQKNDKSQCEFCNGVFKNARGLGTHLRKCPKNSANQHNTNQPTQTTSETTEIPSEIPTTQANQPEQRGGSEETPTDGAENGVWGSHSGEEIKVVSHEIYEEIVFWRNNLFALPSGAAGKRYIRENTRLIEIWLEDKTPYQILQCQCCLACQKCYSKNRSESQKQSNTART